MHETSVPLGYIPNFLPLLYAGTLVWDVIFRHINKGKCIWQFIIWFSFLCSFKPTQNTLGNPPGCLLSILWSLGCRIKLQGGLSWSWVKSCVCLIICQCHPPLPLPSWLHRSVFVHGVAQGPSAVWAVGFLLSLCLVLEPMRTYQKKKNKISSRKDVKENWEEVSGILS